MTAVSEDIVRSIGDLVAIGELAPGSDPAEIADLVVTSARDLAGLENFVNLTTLSIISAEAPTYASLFALRNLRVLVIEHSTLEDATTLPLANLRVLRLRHNRVSSLAGLDAATNLQVLDVTGNPLDLESLRLVDGFAATGVLCTRDDDPIAELNRTLREAGSSYVCSGTAAECTLTLTGLDGNVAPERVMASTTFDAVSQALVNGTLHDLARKESST